MFEEHENEEDHELSNFPSDKLLMRLYVFGAIMALIMSLNNQYDEGQAAVSLLISWFLAAGALAINTAIQKPRSSEDKG